MAWPTIGLSFEKAVVMGSRADGRWLMVDGRWKMEDG